MTVPFYTSTREYESRKREFDEALQRVIARGDFILGTEVAEFEKKRRATSVCPTAIGVASGSDALVIGSDLLGFKDGAEVLTTNPLPFCINFLYRASWRQASSGRPGS